MADHRYVLKDKYWKMRIPHPYSMLCTSNHLGATCGQAPIGEYGDVLFPGDLQQQSEQVINTMDRILNDAGMQQKDIERIVVFVSEQAKAQCEKSTTRFKQHGPTDATVYDVILPPLFYDDLLLEVDYYAIPNRSHNRAVQSFCVQLPIESLATDFSEQQSARLQQSIQTTLRASHLEYQDIVKLSFYSPCKSKTFWDTLAAHRRNWFTSSGPVVSEVVTQSCLDNKLIVDVTCVNEPSWGPVQRLGATLARGNPEAIRIGPLFFSSALFLPSDVDERPLSVTEEVNLIMQRHESLLAIADLGFEDVVKATTFYDGAGSADALHENMSARNAYYKVPGPGSTGLPVSGFSHSGIRTSIELIASCQ